MAAPADFLADDTGAVTIDWVMVTSAVLLLGIAVAYVIFGSGAQPVVNNLNSELKSYKIDPINGFR